MITMHLYSFAFAKQCPAELLLRNISRRFTSCVACQCFAIASPIDATRCFCFSLPHRAPLLLCALACVNACWRVLARVASARRFYAFPSPCNPKHYLAFAFPLFSFGPQCSTVLLRCLCSLCFAIAVHGSASLYSSSAIPGFAVRRQHNTLLFYSLALLFTWLLSCCSARWCVLACVRYRRGASPSLCKTIRFFSHAFLMLLIS